LIITAKTGDIAVYSEINFSQKLSIESLDCVQHIAITLFDAQNLLIDLNGNDYTMIMELCNE
jgi:hypothetical protein